MRLARCGACVSKGLLGPGPLIMRDAPVSRDRPAQPSDVLRA